MSQLVVRLIEGVARRGLSTTWSRLEKAGVPTVVILSNGFQHDADASAKAFGMGPIPRVEVPLVYNNITTEQAIEQTDPVVDEIMELLTQGISGEEIENQALRDAQEKRFKFNGEDQFGALDEFNKEFLDRDWGDGFPLIPPTDEKVERMLSGDDAGCGGCGLHITAWQWDCYGTEDRGQLRDGGLRARTLASGDRGVSRDIEHGAVRGARIADVDVGRCTFDCD